MKILAIASAGGHWIQLLRLRKAFEGHETVYVSTKGGYYRMVQPDKFFSIPDSNRSNKFGILFCYYKVWGIVRSVNPDLIITTGAAPGLMGILVRKLLGTKTVWVDSIANVEQISMSGKIAMKLAD